MFRGISLVYRVPGGSRVSSKVMESLCMGPVGRDTGRRGMHWSKGLSGWRDPPSPVHVPGTMLSSRGLEM